MRLNITKFNFAALTAALVFSGYISAAPDYATDSYSELDLHGFSELDVAYNNYAEVSLSNTNNSQVVVMQKQFGQFSNKAKVSMSNASGSDVSLLQVGSGNVAGIEQRDGVNELSLVQVGYGHEAYIIQDGNFNSADIIQMGRFGDVNLIQSNGGNQATIIDFRGSDYSISQSGDSRIVVVNSMRRNISIEQ